MSSCQLNDTSIIRQNDNPFNKSKTKRATGRRSIGTSSSPEIKASCRNQGCTSYCFRACFYLLRHRYEFAHDQLKSSLLRDARPKLHRATSCAQLCYCSMLYEMAALVLWSRLYSIRLGKALVSLLMIWLETIRWMLSFLW